MSSAKKRHESGQTLIWSLSNPGHLRSFNIVLTLSLLRQNLLKDSWVKSNLGKILRKLSDNKVNSFLTGTNKGFVCTYITSSSRCQGTDARLQLSWLPICHQLDNLLSDIIYWVRTLSPISAQLAQVMTEHELSPETRSSSFDHLDIILLMFMVTLIQPPGTGPGSS